MSDLTNTAAFVETLGIGKLSILRFVPQGRGLFNAGLLDLGRDEEDQFVQELVDFRRRTSLEIRTGSPFNGIVPDNNVPCRAGFRKLVVQADGNVLPCEVFKEERRRDWGASVYEMSLAQILAAPQFVALRKTLAEGRCTACPVHGPLRASQLDMAARHGISKATV
ncbi:MAG: SPASM domain-containing protein [Planctomycetota bacterium]|nr:SPASM domain-containing protein [Planctomycetota bacterium]